MTCVEHSCRLVLPLAEIISVGLTNLTLSNFILQIGRTEVVKDNQNPHFVKAFEIEYYFEEVQRLRFDVYVCFLMFVYFATV